jgi:hypothetical protein
MGLPCPEIEKQSMYHFVEFMRISKKTWKIAA